MENQHQWETTCILGGQSHAAVIYGSGESEHPRENGFSCNMIIEFTAFFSVMNYIEC